MKTRGINRPEKLWNKGAETEDTRRDEVPERERRPRLARGDEEPRSDLTEIINRNPTTAANGPPVLIRELSTTSEPPTTIERGQENQSPTLPAIDKPLQNPGDTLSNVQSQYPQPQRKGIRAVPGARGSPIEGDNGNPSPVRRSLFSSPRSNGPLGVDIQSKRYPLASQAIILDDDEFGFIPSVEDVNVDESTVQNDGGIAKERLSVCPTTPKSQALQLPPVTPMHHPAIQDSSFSKSPSNLFKTPSNVSGRSSSNHRITTSDFFSSSAKNLLHGACIDKTPSKSSEPRSPNAESSRFSPQFPRLLRAIYGTTPPGEEFSETFNHINHLESDCCSGNANHDENCPRKILGDSRLTDAMDLPILTGLDFADTDFQPSFTATEEEWAATDAFFASNGITGFTPRRPVSLGNEQQLAD